MAYIQINKDNYIHNIECMCKKAGGKDKLMVVLKDNAYGHGLEIMAKISSEYGITKTAVKNLDEAKRVHSLFDEVLILADHPPKELQASNISFASHYLEGLKKFPKKSCIHMSLDTGMHRNGIREENLEEALKIIIENELVLKGIFTHFRSADELSCEQYWQEENYKKFCKKAKELILKHGIKMPKFHSCNSAALLRRNTPIEDDFARSGIATFGYTHVPESFLVPSENNVALQLKPVMSLWTEKISSRHLLKGDRVGYGGMYELQEDGTVSTYDIGYGDGFFRHDGKSELVLEGKQVLGRVSMDSLSFLGDEEVLCLFKDAHYIAEKFNTITYDVITKLSPFIKKVVV